MIDRILIVGYGSIGKRHLRIAREYVPNADIRVLRHQECPNTPEYSNGCFSKVEHALTFNPQLAVIANPAPFHLSIAQLLAETGTHLLIEKPISVSVDGVQNLIDTCRKHKVIILTGYNLRYLSSLQKYRELLKDNCIGDVLSIRCEVGQYLPSWRPDADYKEGVSARKELGGGVLSELSHEIDYLRWIFGEVDWVKATLSQQSSLAIDVEDTAHLIIGFLPEDTNKQPIGVLSMDFIRHDTTRICTAIGDAGTLRWNGVTGVVELFKLEAKEWHEVFKYNHQRDDSYSSEWKHFLDCVKNQKFPFINGEDGLAVLNIIEAARHAAETGKQVQIATSHKIGFVTA